MKSEYEFSITKVNYIINRLSDDDRQKIPGKVIDFFDKNSNEELLPSEFLCSNNVIGLCDDSDKKFLKIIDYYINK